jgi:signal transduction histidine kinase
MPLHQTPANPVSPPPWLRLTALAAGGYALAAGAITLTGWLARLPRLTDWEGVGIAMFANTALAAAAIGAALVLTAVGRGRQVAAALALGAAVLGGATLAEHLLRIDLGIDTLLVRRPWGTRAAVAPGRMGPPASISFLLLGISLLLLRGGPRARRAAHGLGLLTAVLAGLPTVGYLFGADLMYTVPRLTGIALQTATAVVAASVGVVALVPEYGAAALLCRDDAGGVLARRLLGPVLVLPLVLGWLCVGGQAAGLFDAAFGEALLVVAMALTLTWAVAVTAPVLGRANAQLREADRRKDEFLAVLAHELRNPLAPIRNAVQYLRLKGPDDPAQRAMRDLIDRQVGHLTRLVDDLLDVSRITRGKFTLRKERITLGAAVDTAVEASRPALEAARHELTVEMPGEPLYLDGDLTRLAQVVGNLLNNAAKYTNPGGEVRLTVRREGG